MLSSTSTTAIFEEHQAFIRAWWWLLPPAHLVTLGPVWVVPKTTLLAKLTVASLLLLVDLLFVWMRLDVKIDSQGIRYRMRPLAWRCLSWADVPHASLRSYDPLTEYGGWGIKGTAKNRAYNVSGSDGLQLELADGRRLLLGTQRPEELARVLAKLGVAAG